MSNFRVLLLLLLAAGFGSIRGESGKLNFMMVGDWGGQPKKPYYTLAQLEVAEQMGIKAADVGSSFTVSVGDNFYQEGVTDIDDYRFRYTFEVSKEELSYGYTIRKKIYIIDVEVT